jgi:hypothetical protein
MCSSVLTPPKQRPGTKPWLKNPIAMSEMAGTALTMANMSLSSKGPSLGLWCDCNYIQNDCIICCDELRLEYTSFPPSLLIIMMQ